MRIPYAIGQRGAVAAAHPLAVEAGLTMLRAGGNAMDAAIATAFALTLVDPGNSSLGGRGSLVAYLPDDAVLRRMLRDAGFAAVGRQLLQGGLSQILSATRAGAAPAP